MIQVTPVILCGGSGTRLWPLSRTGFPKQFLCLMGNESLFQLAARRLVGLGSETIHVASPLIVTGEEHRFLAIEQMRETGIPLGAALLEPVGRNTAPALTLAALAAMQDSSDPVLVVTPADQTMVDAEAFTSAAQTAIKLAHQGSIVILGVTPIHPNSSYGYIQVEADLTPAVKQTGVHTVKSFVEKPNTSTARQYLAEGNYFWNAGMFVIKASVWLKVLGHFRPDISQPCTNAWIKRSVEIDPYMPFVRPDIEEFISIPSESVDFAVMERCPGSIFPIHMVELDAGWSDLGAWDAVLNTLPKDESGSAHTGDVLTVRSHSNLVHASSRLVCLVGVSDLIVVETSDAVMVADKSCSQEVKDVVVQLQESRRSEHTTHRKVHRPWGWYDSIDEGCRFKVKRIQVKPGASLSLQKHHYRAEHWIVVKGTAEIIIGSKVMILNENQSTFIPQGELHRLSNPGTTPLEIIEVQSGSYLGEDDIVRFDDAYGRK
jgi:mannose-1-phosphate guanylyltransferase/mannose-6-phosphate isomerase